MHNLLSLEGAGADTSSSLVDTDFNAVHSMQQPGGSADNKPDTQPTAPTEVQADRSSDSAGDSIGWERVSDSLGSIPGPRDSVLDLSSCIATALTNRTELVDSAEKYIVKATAGSSDPVCIIKVSSAIDPHSEAQSIANARAFANAVDEDAARHILAPLHEATVDGRSVGVYNWLEPLVATNPGWLLQRRRLLPHVTQWLETVTRNTARSCNDAELQTMFVAPLQRVVQDGAELGPDYQRVAKRALSRIEKGEFNPRLSAMHGDPSRNNIMLDRSNATGFSKGSRVSRFKFIDWSSARVDAYPFYDLIRVGNTLRAGISQHLKTHLEIVDCAEEDVSAYVTASLGNLRDNLRYCPRHVFALSAQKYLADLADNNLL